MTKQTQHELIRHKLLNAMEDVYPAPLQAEGVNPSDFDPCDSSILDILKGLQEEALCSANSLKQDKQGRLIWNLPTITCRGIDYLASHSNMSNTLTAGSQRLHQSTLQPILKDALLLTEKLSVAEKKSYFERIKTASETELLQISKELEEKNILQQSASLF